MLNYPWHTQVIERAVEEDTAAADAVCGADRRDGIITERALHVEQVPKINSKEDLVDISKFSFFIPEGPNYVFI